MFLYKDNEETCLSQYIRKKRQFGVTNLNPLKYVTQMDEHTDRTSICADVVRPQSINRNYEIGYDGGAIQAGSFGKIYKAIEVSTGLSLAAKVINKKDQKPDQIQTEKFIMDCLNGSRHIIPKIYTAEDNNFLIIYMERMPGGDIFSYLDKYDYFDECLSFFIFYQVLEALHTLHLKKINHRDIKLENVVFDNANDMNCYLLDFGLSEFWKTETDPSSYSRGGSTRYAAPEVFTTDTNKPINGVKADYFSLGVALYLMVVGAYPFFGNGDENSDDDGEDDVEEALVLINARKMYGIKRFEELDRDLQSLLLGLLSPNPYSRYTYAEVVRNPWYLYQRDEFQRKGCPKTQEKVVKGKKKGTPVSVSRRKLF